MYFVKFVIELLHIHTLMVWKENVPLFYTENIHSNFWDNITYIKQNSGFIFSLCAGTESVQN